MSTNETLCTWIADESAGQPLPAGCVGAGFRNTRGVATKGAVSIAFVVSRRTVTLVSCWLQPKGGMTLLSARLSVDVTVMALGRIVWQPVASLSVRSYTPG